MTETLLHKDAELECDRERSAPLVRRDDLIIDVGMHNGDDTAHYLESGYRVVAIEANPELVRAAQSRFRDEIASGRLEILNQGIAAQAGSATFWINRSNSELSSFRREMAARFDGVVEAVEIECIPFGDVLRRYGIPHYLKIDIEGVDDECLRALAPDVLPRYVSVEAHSLLPFCQLASLGYDRFKCINQRHHDAPARGINSRPETSRYVREAIRLVKRDIRSRVWGGTVGRSLWNGAHRIKRAIRGLLSSGKMHGEMSGVSADASTAERQCSSGPFGEATYGEWRTFDEVAYDWLHLKQGHPLLSNIAAGGWYDVHAKRSTEDSEPVGPLPL